MHKKWSSILHQVLHANRSTVPVTTTRMSISNYNIPKTDHSKFMPRVGTKIGQYLRISIQMQWQYFLRYHFLSTWKVVSDKFTSYGPEWIHHSSSPVSNYLVNTNTDKGKPMLSLFLLHQSYHSDRWLAQVEGMMDEGGSAVPISHAGEGAKSMAKQYAYYFVLLTNCYHWGREIHYLIPLVAAQHLYSRFVWCFS